MSFLAIETTGAAATVALMDDTGKIITETGEGRMDHLRGLMLMIRSVLQRSGRSPQEIRRIAVSSGPGSFTGIRIGLAAAKTLAQVLDVPVVPVNTLLAMAHNDFGLPADPAAGTGDRQGQAETLLVPMIDARRGQVYAAAYGAGESAARIPEQAVPAEEFLRGVQQYAKANAFRRILFCGDGADANRKLIQNIFSGDGETPEIAIAEGTAAVQNAAGVLRAARMLSEEGQAVSYEEVKAVYLRKAEAERKRETGRLGRKKQKKEPEQILEMPPEDGEIQYRLLETADLDALAALDALCFDKAWSRGSFEGDMSGSRKAVYAGAFNSRGELIGFAGIVYLLDEGDVNRVAVHPLYRAGGIGGRCLETAMEQANQNGVSRLLLEVREANRSAISLYKEHGFKVISKRKGYYAETGENALIMQKTFGGE